MPLKLFNETSDTILAEKIIRANMKFFYCPSHLTFLLLNIYIQSNMSSVEMLRDNRWMSFFFIHLWKCLYKADP